MEGRAGRYKSSENGVRMEIEPSSTRSLDIWGDGRWRVGSKLDEAGGMRLNVE
jgi:hypothetical protein